MTSTLGERLMWRDGDVRVSQCAFCRHKAGDATCAAFPAGIPAGILRNEVSHAGHLEGDRGIRLDPIEIPESLFESVTGLAWPEHAVGYDRVEALVARACAAGSLDGELAAALMRAELLAARPAGAGRDLEFSPARDDQGAPSSRSSRRFPARGVPRTGDAPDPLCARQLPARPRGTPVVLNPGGDAALPLDLAEVRRLASG